MKEIESAIKLLNTETSPGILAKTIEIIFSEITDRITIILPLIKKIEAQKNIMCIGNAIQEMSKVRSALYEEWLHLKLDITKEISENYEQYKKLVVEIDLAYQVEEIGVFAKARKIFSTIRESLCRCSFYKNSGRSRSISHSRARKCITISYSTVPLRWTVCNSQF